MYRHTANWAPSFRGAPNTYREGRFKCRPAGRMLSISVGGVTLRRKSGLRPYENAYEKYTKMHAKFVPYLVRNSLHLCSVFLSGIMVLNVQYFEDHPQK